MNAFQIISNDFTGNDDNDYDYDCDYDYDYEIGIVRMFSNFLYSEFLLM